MSREKVESATIITTGPIKHSCFVFALSCFLVSIRARAITRLDTRAASMAASPDVETDLLSEGSPLRSPSPEVGAGNDVPAEPPMPEPRGDDSESEDDDRRRVKRGRSVRSCAWL